MPIEFTQMQQSTGSFALNYFGARYLDPMLGMWTSVDPARQFASPYLYAGNGYNPVNGVDPDGNSDIVSLRPGTNDINNVTHIDDAFNLVALVSNGSTEYYDAPPAESYFNTENLIGKKIDYTMEAKANTMIEQVNPIMFFWIGKLIMNMILNIDIIVDLKAILNRRMLQP